MAALFGFPAPGEETFLRAWHRHRAPGRCESCAMARDAARAYVRDQRRAVDPHLVHGQRSGQTAYTHTGSSTSFTAAGTDGNDPGTGEAREPCRGRGRYRTLAAAVVDEGAPGLFAVLALTTRQRRQAARSVLEIVAGMCRDGSAAGVHEDHFWWSAGEVIPLLTDTEIYGEIPVGLLLRRRGIAWTPCALGRAFQLFERDLTAITGHGSYTRAAGKNTGVDELVTLCAALANEWEGSLGDLLLAAVDL